MTDVTTASAAKQQRIITSEMRALAAEAFNRMEGLSPTERRLMSSTSNG